MISPALKVSCRSTIRKPLFPLRQHTHTGSLPAKRQQSTTSALKGDPTITNGPAIPVPNTVATLPIWQRLGPLSRAFQAYGRAQRRAPYKTQFVSSLVIYFIGDLSAQKMNGDNYDPARTGRALIISAGSSIPSYKWFIFLGNHFNYASRALSLLTKVVVNQALFTPIFNTYFFGMQSLLSGDALPDVVERIKRTVPISIVNSCKLWPAVTAFSFTFVNPEYRNLFGSVVAIGWQMYLSFLNRRAEIEGAMEKGMGRALEVQEQIQHARLQKLEA